MSSVYKETIAGCEKVTTKKLIQIMEEAKASLRPGIGTKSKLLFTNPKNKEKVRAIVKKVTEIPSCLFNPFPYRVITNHYIPESELMKTGNIVWHDTRFVTYSCGPAPGSGLTDEEYLEMCLSLGWAEEEMAPMTVWYEMEQPSFSRFMDAVMSVKDEVAKKTNDDVARQLLLRETPFVGMGRRHSLLTTFA